MDKFTVGDRIRVIGGPWASDCGIIKKITKVTLKVKLDTTSHKGLALVKPKDAEKIR